MIVNHNINNLSGGVSTQPDEARFDNQVEEMVNIDPFITGEVTRRNPLSLVQSISTHEDMKIHSYDRGDGLEKYLITVGKSGIKVYDAEGNSKTVITAPIENETRSESTLVTHWLFQLKVEEYVRDRLVTIGNVTSGYILLQDNINNVRTAYHIVNDLEDIMIKVFTDKTHWLIFDRGDMSYQAIPLYRFYIDYVSGDYDTSLVIHNDAQLSLITGRFSNFWQFFDSTFEFEKKTSLLTVGDTTWLLNKEISTKMYPELSEKMAVNNRAFYWLKRSFDNGNGKGHDYTLTINGIEFTANSTSSEDAAQSLADSINARYALPENDPSIFQDWIRAIATGSIVYVYVAKIYAPSFRISYGSKPYVRVENEDGDIVGADVRDSETSFNLIIGKWKLYCNIDAATDFYNLLEEAPTTFDVYYYSNASSAVSNTNPDTVVGMDLYVSSDTADFDIEFSDSWGNQASVMWRDKVKKLTDLSASMSGFTSEQIGTIAVTGTDRDEYNNYYVYWDGEVWSETIKEGIKYKIDPTTMPCKMVRQSDGTFVVGYNEDLSTYGYDGFDYVWDDRAKGDDDTNPLPSFIDYPISNMFFFKNRLGFTSGENVILSETAYYYNYFATTVMEIIDSDPIDVSIDTDEVSMIRNVNGISGSLTLWSDNSQFLLSGGEVLTPTTTRVAKSSGYSCDNSISPLVVDNEVMFFNKIGENLSAMSYSASSVNNDKSTAEEISTNVLGYLPSTIYKAVVNSASNMVFLLDENNKYTMYVYKYHIHNNERAMSSWFKWTFANEIKSIEVLDNELFLFLDDNLLAKIDLSKRDVSETFLDFGSTKYDSYVILSKFNVETKQGTRVIREPFYMKNIKVSHSGVVDMDIINSERNNTKKINTKHLNRRLFVGGNSEKVSIGFSSNYDTGFKINTISVEGLLKRRSTNVTSI